MDAVVRTTTTGRAAHASRMAARSPLVRLQSDEKLVALVRRGNDHAFETLVARYSARLLAFCRHMLGSSEDAEDVLQEVFAAAYRAMTADDRPIAVRPWLYRIARNRSLNHIRRAKPIGQDDMDLHLAEHGASTADQAHRRIEFGVLLDDVGRLAETQRTALVLREMEHLSYDQIAQAMDTTVPAVKSLLVRARIGLAEASEARALSCEDVRLDLGAAAEGLGKLTPAVRRHVKACDRCGSFQRHLRQTNRALAAVLPIGPLFVLKQFFLAHLGGAAAGGSASSGGAAAGAGWAGATAGSSSAGGLLSAVTGAVGTKAAAGLAAAALVGGGAVEVQHLSHVAPASHPAAVASAPAPSPVVTHHAVPRAAPAVAARSAALARAAATRAAQPVRHPKPRAPREAKAPTPAPKPAPVAATPVAATPVAATPVAATPVAATPVATAPSAPPTVNSPARVSPTPPETQPVAPVTPTVSDTTVLPAPPPPPGTDAPTGDPTPSNPSPPAGPAVPLPPSNVVPAPPPPPPGDVGR
jgi:RNA polymerase sigma factor (sigma-70 family)